MIFIYFEEILDCDGNAKKANINKIIEITKT